jgi:hypothetical protein
MFSSDRTCCICRERGKATQIHHIDDDPSNNSINNLALLCLECHNDTQVKGGFGRKLNSSLVTEYRDDWINRVSIRRKTADVRAIDKLVGINTAKQQIEIYKSSSASAEVLNDSPIDYINSLPEY